MSTDQLALIWALPLGTFFCWLTKLGWLATVSVCALTWLFFAMTFSIVVRAAS